jgi:hypothetical protein
MDQPIGHEDYERAVERRAVVEDKVRHDVREMLEVLRADIPNFFDLQTKKRFVTHLEFADKLDDAKVKKLRQDIHASAERTASEVVAALEPWDLWAWDARAPFPESPKSLDPNAQVSRVLARIGAGLAKTLADHGVPDADSARDAYKLPSYFVAGRFMKSLVESYWRNLQELVELNRLIDETAHRDRRERNASRWDKA